MGLRKEKQRPKENANYAVDRSRMDYCLPFIPSRFVHRVDMHLLANYAQIAGYPRILCIVGEPGLGKTWQLRERLRELGVEIKSVSAAKLEDEYAGEPAKYLERTFLEGVSIMENGGNAAIVIDDFDTTVGEWEQNTGTVNHQAILAFLMHAAEEHPDMEERKAKRLPIFITANDSSKIYRPLMRYGRTDLFKWEPLIEERACVIASILGIKQESDTSRQLAAEYTEFPLSFFSHLKARVKIESIASVVEKMSITELINNPRSLNALNDACEQAVAGADWAALARMAADASNTI